MTTSFSPVAGHGASADVVFVGRRNTTEGTPWLVAVSAVDGADLWQYAYNPERENDGDTGGYYNVNQPVRELMRRPTISLDGGTVFVGGDTRRTTMCAEPPCTHTGAMQYHEHQVHALDARSGAVLWTTTTQDATSRPALSADGTALFVAHQNGVQKFRASDGAELWSNNILTWPNHPRWVVDTYALPVVSPLAPPAPGAAKNSFSSWPVVYASTDYGGNIVLNASNGELLAELPAAYRIPGGKIAVSDDGGLVLTHAYAAASSQTGSCNTSQICFDISTPKLRALDVRSGFSVKWTWTPLAGVSFGTQSLNGKIGSPLVAGATTYVCSGGYLYALATATGKEVWSYRVGAPIGRSAGVEQHSLLALRNGTVFVASYGIAQFVASQGLNINMDIPTAENFVHAVDAKTGKRRWRFSVAGSLRPSLAVSADGAAVFAASWFSDGSVNAGVPTGLGLLSEGALYAITNCSTLAAPSAAPACAVQNCSAGKTGGDAVFGDAAMARACRSCDGGSSKALTGPGDCILCAVKSGTAGREGAAKCFDCPNCAAGGVCEKGYKGRACTSCAPGFASFQGECTLCPDEAWLTMMPLVLLLVVALWLVRKFKRATDAAVKSELLKHAGVDQAKLTKVVKAGRATHALMRQVSGIMTLLGFVQMSTTIIKMRFSWPVDVQWFADIAAKVGELDLMGASAPECSTGLSFTAETRAYLGILVPLSPLLLACFLIVMVRLVALPCACLGKLDSFSAGGGCCSAVFCCCRQTADAVWKTTGAIFGKALALFLVTFAGLTVAATSAFDCFDGGDGYSYMRDQPDVCCSTAAACQIGVGDGTTMSWGGASGGGPGAVQVSAVGLACCVLVIVIIPTYLRCNKAKLRGDERFMTTYGSLYLRYDTVYYGWEAVVLLRKLLLVLIARVLSSDQAAQIACSAAVLGGALLLQLLCKPFLSDALDRLERDTLAACLVIVALGAASNAGADAVAVMVAFYAILLAAAGVVGNDLLLVWREGNDDDDAAAADDDAAADGSTAKLPIVGAHAGTKILV
jgi:outer membrane protein assembly factor BamB